MKYTILTNDGVLVAKNQSLEQAMEHRIANIQGDFQYKEEGKKSWKKKSSDKITFIRTLSEAEKMGVRQGRLVIAHSEEGGYYLGIVKRKENKNRYSPEVARKEREAKALPYIRESIINHYSSIYAAYAAIVLDAPVGYDEFKQIMSNLIK